MAHAMGVPLAGKRAGERKRAWKARVRSGASGPRLVTTPESHRLGLGVLAWGPSWGPCCSVGGLGVCVVLWSVGCNFNTISCSFIQDVAL
jgi:hypothetical protein